MTENVVLRGNSHDVPLDADGRPGPSGPRVLLRQRQEDQPEVPAEQRLLRPPGGPDRRREGPRVQDGRATGRDDAQDRLQVGPEGLPRHGRPGRTERTYVRLLQS